MHENKMRVHKDKQLFLIVPRLFNFIFIASTNTLTFKYLRVVFEYVNKLSQQTEKVQNT